VANVVVGKVILGNDPSSRNGLQPHYEQICSESNQF
jgi:hypothetical protein